MRLFWILLGALIAVSIGWSPIFFDGRWERWLFYIPFAVVWSVLGFVVKVYE